MLRLTPKDEASGLRVFNALVDGKTFAEGVDIFNLATNFTALTMGATIQLSAFSITLDFQAVIENPKIAGFEIHDVTGTFVQPTLINCGGAAYTDGDNRTWMADTFFTGGSPFLDSTFPIAGTDDDPLFQSERNGAFSYDIPVATGTYNIILSFAELFWDTSNQRLFDIFVQGALSYANVDIIVVAGSNLTAAQLSVNNVASVDGFISIDFVQTSPVVDQPKISTIEVIEQ